MMYIDVFFFFFQAEDGIRDATVTGVQTCALPICIIGLSRFGRDGKPETWPATADKTRDGSQEVLRSCLLCHPFRSAFNNRSEERRVGKECRYRWSRCH